jgi:myo-inositol-1(or 4)-monophosphatase
MSSLLDIALQAADAAAAVHVRWAGRIALDRATKKGIGDFVTQADFEAQEAAITVIRGAFPEHAIMAEEDDAPDARAGSASHLWVIDPLDGTANFLHGHPMYASSVAVTENGRSLAGAVVCSTSGERWWAAKGGGAWKSVHGGTPTRIAVSMATTLDGGLVGTGFPFKTQHLIPEYLQQLAGVLRAGSGVRRGGAAAIDLCYLAEGRFDGFWELFLSPWDFAAGRLIIEEAGGVVSRMDGSPLTLEPGGVMGANSAGMLKRLLGVIQGE